MSKRCAVIERRDDELRQQPGKLAGLFHKKSDSPPADDAGGPKASAAPAASAAPLLPQGMVPVITMSSELLSVSTAAVDPRVFEVPADFKLKQK
jgi:hypothetical protein